MNDYRSIDEKLVFSPRMERVYQDILPRLKHNRDREGTETSPVGTDGKDPFVDVFEEMPDTPLVVAQAHAIVRSWMVTPFLIFRDEPLVGITRPQYPNIEHFHWGIMTDGLRHKLDEQTPEEQERRRRLIRRMEPMTEDYINKKAVELLGEEKWGALHYDGLFSAGGYQGHTIANYVTLLERGLDGMLEYIDECEAKVKAEQPAIPERDRLYEACRIIVSGMSQWLEGYAAKAKELAESESDADQKRWYLEISENCAFVAHKKPETLYQAAQLVWTLCLWDWVDCIGRTDQYLLPFYNKSKDGGDVVSAEDVIVSFVFKIWENGVHNLSLGGVKPADGSDATNELSYLLLQVIRTIHDTHPRMSVRVHDETPRQLLDLVVKMWQEGMSDPTVVGDNNVIPGLTAIGVPIEDARDYSELGCQEIEIPGKSNFGCEDGVFSLPKVLEYTMNDGYSKRHPGVRIGPATGRFVDFESFEAFYRAFEIQLRYCTEIFLKLCDAGQKIRMANYSKLVKTPFTTGCLEKGRPHDAGGPIYNFGCVETAGLAPTSDSMVAIKKLVFEEKKISKQTLMDALDANFEGYEKERRMLLNMAPKFGNDNDEADAMAVRVLDTFWTMIGEYKSVRGDVYTGACSLLQGGINFGSCMGAMPDGRFAREPFGNTMGPRPGADKNGVSAMLNSVKKLPLHKGVGGTTLNVVLTTKLLSNPALRDSITATMRSFLLEGGQMAQITTANVEDLLDAREHPERHGDLIVRIGGFSIQFVQLGSDAQKEIISRYDSAC